MLGDMVRRPLNTRIVIASSGAQAGPVAELGAKPLSAMAFGTAILEPSKIVSHLVLSEELARQMTPDANAAVAYELRKAVGLSTDQYFVDVLITAPGVTSIASSGSTAANFITDLQAALGAINISDRTPSFICCCRLRFGRLTPLSVMCRGPSWPVP
jgi:HK97 family phage major capsid protein